MKIRHRHLGRWNKEKPAAIDSIHILLKFWQLSGSKHALPLHKERRTHLGVAVLARMKIEKEI